jgi:hypothetical protein
VREANGRQHAPRKLLGGLSQIVTISLPPGKKMDIEREQKRFTLKALYG